MLENARGCFELQNFLSIFFSQKLLVYRLEFIAVIILATIKKVYVKCTRTLALERKWYSISVETKTNYKFQLKIFAIQMVCCIFQRNRYCHQISVVFFILNRFCNYRDGFFWQSEYQRIGKFATQNPNGIKQLDLLRSHFLHGSHCLIRHRIASPSQSYFILVFFMLIFWCLCVGFLFLHFV